MNNDHDTSGSNHNPSNPTTVPMSGGDPAKKRGFAGRARAAAGAIPSQIDRQVKRSPYLTIGIAAALGTGVGIVFSSRVLRAVMTTVATAAAVELGRAYFRKNAWVVKAS
jgi:hypothetical protein